MVTLSVAADLFVALELHIHCRGGATALFRITPTHMTPLHISGSNIIRYCRSISDKALLPKMLLLLFRTIPTDIHIYVLQVDNRLSSIFQPFAYTP